MNGLAKVLRALWRRSLYLWFIPGILAAVIIFLIRPLWCIRFCIVGFERIGNLYVVLYYWNLSAAGEIRKRTTNIFYLTPHVSFVANRQWQLMITRKTKFFPLNGLCWAVERVLSRLPRPEAHQIPVFHPPTGDLLTLIWQAKAPLLEFTAEERRLGEEGLRRLGVPDRNEFICFHTRDAAYLNNVGKGKDWTYHDYRDTGIKNYVAAVERYLMSSERYALRMGAVVAEDVAMSHPHMLDYATTRERGDLMDIYLSARCRFFLGTDCGMTIFPETFRRPMVYVNWVADTRVPYYCHNGRVIMKKWYDIRGKRFLTFSEMFRLLGNSNMDIRGWGVELVDNTPDEILAVMAEIDEVIDGKWDCTKEDERLQARFWDLCGREKWHSAMFRVGREFLRDNAPALGIGR